MQDPVAFAALSNPDILYYHEAMKAHDWPDFYKAMQQEVDSHTNNKHWKIVRRSEVPMNQNVLPSVWAFRRKRRIATNEVYKWKACLNIHRDKQEHGVNYWETYTTVVGWPTIRKFFNLMVLNNWQSRQINFVLAFPQEDIECDMHMDVPIGFDVEGDAKDYVLLLKRNLYGQEQAGRVWNTYMHDGLITRGFLQSSVDMCVYYRGSVVLMIYTDDGIFIGPDQEQIQECYNILTKEIIDQRGTHFREFKMTDEGDISDYLGVKITPLKNETYKLHQPQLINDSSRPSSKREKIWSWIWMALSSLLTHSTNELKQLTSKIPASSPSREAMPLTI